VQKKWGTQSWIAKSRVGWFWKRFEVRLAKNPSQHSRTNRRMGYRLPLNPSYEVLVAGHFTTEKGVPTSFEGGPQLRCAPGRCLRALASLARHCRWGDASEGIGKGQVGGGGDRDPQTLVDGARALSYAFQFRGSVGRQGEAFLMDGGFPDGSGRRLVFASKSFPEGRTNHCSTQSGWR